MFHIIVNNILFTRGLDCFYEYMYKGTQTDIWFYFGSLDMSTKCQSFYVNHKFPESNQLICNLIFKMLNNNNNKKNQVWIEQKLGKSG